MKGTTIMRLKDSFKNEFGEIEGTAFFPYFNENITVICRDGVASEYVEKCLQYLEEVDETLMFQICKYAEYFLKDKLETTSIGEIGDEEAFPYENLLDLQRYFHFGILYIDAPPEPVAETMQTHVLNLSGGCDWWEDEGLQCLVKDGEVVYLGYFNRFNIWNGCYSEAYIGNYALYEKRDELRKKAAEKRADTDTDTWRKQRFTRYRAFAFFAARKLENFVDKVLAPNENMDEKSATVCFENSYLYQLMTEYPKLLEESTDFWYECYRIEQEQDIGELVRYICENCAWEMF